jgi:hypothetical protein
MSHGSSGIIVTRLCVGCPMQGKELCLLRSIQTTCLYLILWLRCVELYLPCLLYFHCGQKDTFVPWRNGCTAVTDLRSYMWYRFATSPQKHLIHTHTHTHYFIPFHLIERCVNAWRNKWTIDWLYCSQEPASNPYVRQFNSIHFAVKISQNLQFVTELPV